MRDSGEFPKPFVPGGESVSQPTPTPATGFAPPFIPGAPLDTPPEVITDQVAGLTPLAAQLPFITDFLYEEAPASEAGEPEPEVEQQGYQAEPQPYEADAPEPPPQRETPVRPTPVRPTPARPTPARGFVPPLPGFSPSRGTPAFPQQEYQPRATPRMPAPAAGWSTPPHGGSPPPADAPVARPGDAWATGEWQRFDWRSAASLAPEERARAAQAWSDLDWEADTKSKVRERTEAIARALEGIARRVRSGELLVHGHPGMTEEAAAAAALAALLARRT
jgi:hypothetical protein